MKKRLPYIGILIILLLFVLPKVFKYIRLDKAKGEVVRMNTGNFRSLTKSSEFFYPTIRYKVGDSTCYYSKNNEVLYFLPKVGEPITILYNENSPEETYLNRVGSFWFSLPDLLIFGLLCLAWIGVCGIIFASGTRS